MVAGLVGDNLAGLFMGANASDMAAIMTTLKNFWVSLDAVGRTVAIVVVGLLLLAVILTNYDVSWILNAFGF